VLPAWNNHSGNVQILCGLVSLLSLIRRSFIFVYKEFVSVYWER